jgi:hypothetical protein
VTTEKPHYSRRPLGSVRALAYLTGTSTGYLHKLARTAPKSYQVVHREGKTKVTYNPAAPLKEFQQKLIKVLLAAVAFPSYINGGVRGRSCRDDCALHVRAGTVVKLDIATFYESVSRQEVKKLWQQFFNFPPEVAELLTDLTTHRGHLPRGAPTSSYLANLLFWREEPKLHAELAQQDIRYSRYVDDVSLSVQRDMDSLEVANAVACVYGMFKEKGIKPNRKKRRVMRRGGALRVHNINVGGVEPSIPKSVRDEIRASLHNLEKAVQEDGPTGNLQGRIRHVGGKVAWLRQFHPEQGARAQEKLVAILGAGAPGVPDQEPF